MNAGMLFAASTLAAVAGANVSAPPADASVQDVLRAQLESRYPDVQRWGIRPLRAEADAVGSERPAVAEQGGRVEIVRLGARSAVRVGRHLEWYAVSGFREVLGATRTVGARQPLDSSIARLEEKDVLSLRCEPLVDAAVLIGKRARKPLHVDEVICAESIEPRPNVSRGDTVTVRYVGSRVTLSTTGVAQADANIGDTLAIRNTGSEAVFSARVSGIGEVTIHE